MKCHKCKKPTNVVSWKHMKPGDLVRSRFGWYTLWTDCYVFSKRFAARVAARVEANDCVMVISCIPIDEHTYEAWCLYKGTYGWACFENTKYEVIS